MKKIYLTVIMTLAVVATAYGQAKRPTIMVVPNQTWCAEHGYTKTLATNGGTKTVPDYEEVFLRNGDMKVAITNIGACMSEADFPLVDMEQRLNAMAVSNAEEIAATSKTGADVSVTPLDIINQRAKADIIFDLYWKVNTAGFGKTLTYNLKAIDAYTSKQIGGISSTTRPSNTCEVPVLLQEAVNGSMDELEGQLMSHFNNLLAKGREVMLEIRLWDDCGFDLEEEYGGQELNQVIEDWMSENTVNGVYSVLDATETRMNFEQVRIPLYDERGRAQDATRWARGLANHLKSLGIVTKVNARGLGRATLTLGGK